MIAISLEEEADITVIGQPTTVDDALVEVIKQDIDVVLVSTHLPDGGAIQLTQSLTRSNPAAKVVVLGLTETREQVLPFIEAGAAGYVLKDDSVEQMIECIRRVNADRAIVSPEIASVLMSRVVELARLLAEIKPAAGAPDELTPRELEVLDLIKQRMTNQQIADRLVIEVGTVKNHVHSILEKLDVNNRMDAAAYIDVFEEARKQLPA
jgi:DNA-binding NarL/FixJ family response regulator